MKKILLVGALFASIVFNQSCSKTVDGCTDSRSTNFNPDANNDDGSCEYGDVILLPDGTVDGATDYTHTLGLFEGLVAERQSGANGDSKGVAWITPTVYADGGRASFTAIDSLKEIGFVYATHENPTVADGKVVAPKGVSSVSYDFGLQYNGLRLEITGLQEFTTYYIRAYAIDDVETSYTDDERSFTTTGNGGSFIQSTNTGLVDHDGNSYSSVVLGNGQEWFTSDMKAISAPNLVDTTEFFYAATFGNKLTEPYYRPSEYGTKANLYNGRAIVYSSMCPTGYRTPEGTDGEALVEYLSDEDDFFGYSKKTALQTILGTDLNVSATAAQWWLNGNSLSNTAEEYLGINTSDNTIVIEGANNDTGKGIRCFKQH